MATVTAVRLWKWIGLAGVIGAASVGGAVAVQRRRARTWDDEVSPEDLRARLHERLGDRRTGAAAATG